MKIFDFSVKRPVGVMMIVLIVVILGAVSYSRLGLDLFPEMELPMLLVQTSYSGVSPHEIEEQVTRLLEGAVGTVSGVKSIMSMSSRGSSLVMAEFDWGADLNFATNQIRDRLDLYANALPSGATKPTIIKMDPSAMPIMQIALSGDATLEELTMYVDDTLQPRLERVNGVASVSGDGAVTEEIRLVADPQRLQAYGVSLNQISALLYQENSNVSGGTVEEGMKEHAVRIVGEFTDIDDIKNLQVASAYGGYISLGSLVEVQQTIEDRTSYVYINGQPGISLSLMKQSDANLVQTSQAVRQTLAEMAEELPGSYALMVAFDQADYINLSLNNVVNSAVQGGILAILILVVFLQSWRSTLIIGISIPVSIITAFAIMFFTNITLNLVSLGGLALGLGMMVDNSIVVLENIFRHRQDGKSAVRAAIEGGKEVAGAVVASTVTTVVVFLPIVFVEGLASQIFGQMALTITCSLLASLAVAFLVVPMLSNKLLVVEKPKKTMFSWLSKGVQGVLDAMHNGYVKLLALALRHKGMVVTATFVLLAGCLFLLPQVGMEFIPSQDTGEYSVTVTLPKGAALRETLRVSQQIEAIIQEVPENAQLISSVGGGGNVMSSFLGGSSNTATFSGILLPIAQRQRSLEEVLEDIRFRLKDIPGAEIEVASSGTMIMTGSDIQINLMGQDLDQLEILAAAVAQQVAMVEGTREVTTSLEEGNPEVNVVVDRQKAAQYGLNSSTVAATVTGAISGTASTKFRQDGKEMDIRLVLDEEYRQNLNDLAALTITSASGSVIPLGNIATLEIVTSPTSIIRQNQSRQVSVTCSVVGRSLADVARDIQVAIDRMNLPPEIVIEQGGSNQEMIDAFSDLGMALILAVVLVYMVMAFQFEQLLYPFVIMFALPPTFIGVILGLYLTGRTINVVSLIGIIMLAGIVVNNAIVLVDYVNIMRREKGMSREEALMEAGETRLRPIMMTTLTTILGMLPIAIGGGEGGELMAPMGTVVASGLTVSTLITLVLVPCMYTYAEDIALKIARLFRRKDRGGQGSDGQIAGA